MRYLILGPLEVRDGAIAVPLAHGRQRVLLAVLLLHANEVVSRDRLIDLLWGGSPPAAASGSLHNLVSGLRKGPCGDALVTQGQGYVLRVADGELDLQRFATLLAHGRSALAAGNADAAATHLRAALGLWRGAALADLVHEPALQDEAARLEDERLSALEDRIDADLTLSHHGDLVGELAMLSAAHPLRERLRGQQMLALYRTGRQAEALEVFAAARRYLLDEVGIEPGPELRRLHQAVLDQDADLGGHDRLPPAPRPRPSLTTRGRRHPRVLVAGGALLLAAAAGAAALALTSGGSANGGELASLSGDSLVAIDSRSNRVVAEVPLGSTPTSVTAAAGAVWTVSADRQTIARVDARTKQREFFGVGATPTDVVAADGGLWVGSGVAEASDVGVQTSRLLRVDAETQTVRNRLDLPAPRSEGPNGAPGQIAVGAGAVWALNGGGELSRIDAVTGQRGPRPRTLRLRSIAADARSVWAIAADDPVVVRIDANSGRVASRIRIPTARLDAIAVGAGAVWIADAYGGNLWRIDPGPTAVTRTIAVGGGADGVSVGAGAVWVINSLRGTVVRVDPRRNSVVATVAVGNTPRDIDVGAGVVWVTLGGGAQPVPAAGSAVAGGPPALSRRICGPVFKAGDAQPDVLIASDLPLQAGPLQTQPIANAIAFVLRRQRFRAGRHHVGLQSCDSSTAESGRSEPAKCAANAKAYAADRAVVGIIGPLQSDCAKVQIPIANRAAGGPLAIVGPSTTYVGLTHDDPTAPSDVLRRIYPTGARNYARLSPAEDVQAAADALLARRLGSRRPYVLRDATPYGREMAVHFTRAARAIGLEVAGHAGWDPQARKFARLADRVAQSRADSVFMSGTVGSNGGPLTRALRARLGPRVALIAPDAFGPLEFLWEFSGGAAKGMYISLPGVANARLGERGRRFIREFSATQPGPEVGSLAVHAAAATEVLLAAIARSDGTRASVTRALMTTRLDDGITGPVRFDRNGDRLQAPVTIVRVRARTGVSDVESFEGAAINSVITPPHDAVR